MPRAAIPNAPATAALSAVTSRNPKTVAIETNFPEETRALAISNRNSFLVLTRIIKQTEKAEVQVETSKPKARLQKPNPITAKQTALTGPINRPAVSATARDLKLRARVSAARDPNENAAAGKIVLSAATSQRKDGIENRNANALAMINANPVRKSAINQRSLIAVGRMFSTSSRRITSTVKPRSPGIATRAIAIIAKPKRPKSLGPSNVARAMPATCETPAESACKEPSHPRPRTNERR